MYMLDPTTFKYDSSRLRDLYMFLKGKGHDVYFPGQHKGECNSKYIVIRYDGTSGISTVSSRKDLYALLLYVPKDKYSEIEGFVQEVRRDMKELEPLFMVFNEQQLATVYDDAIDANYVSIEYSNPKKN